MTNEGLFALILLPALGCGLIAGAFFGFSVFVMRALRDLPTAQGIAAMRSINVAVINPWFMGALFGTAALCVVGIVRAARDLADAGAGLLLTGSLLYLILTVGVTVAFNVPLNDRLAGVDPASAEAPATWAGYVTRWSRWNHVRTAGALAASGAFIVALAQHAGAAGGVF